MICCGGGARASSLTHSACLAQLWRVNLRIHEKKQQHGHWKLINHINIVKYIYVYMIDIAEHDDELILILILMMMMMMMMMMMKH